MIRNLILATLLLAGGTAGYAALQPQGATVEVFKSPTCGCCGKWVDHLRAAGFTVTVTDTAAVDQIKAKYKVPAAVRSCHTAVAGGYVIEGHVPAADVQRLLREKPAVAGIAVGGMPIGSPGMEVPNVRPAPYDVKSFDANGTIQIFSSHNR